jgi:hypothetical protein
VVTPLKLRGMDELQSLIHRTRRLCALERITVADHDYIMGRLQEVEARIQQMPELDTDMKEVIVDS